MIRRFDHVTIVVQDLDAATQFFGALGFREDINVVISGEPFASCMGVPGIEADHVTLVADSVEPRTEIQLLHYRAPAMMPDPHIRDLRKIGLNHICFSVDDIAKVTTEMRSHGFATKNDVMDFHARKLIFLEGPEGVTIELSEWH